MLRRSEMTSNARSVVVENISLVFNFSGFSRCDFKLNFTKD
jgi:hypothetical protein